MLRVVAYDTLIVDLEKIDSNLVPLNLSFASSTSFRNLPAILVLALSDHGGLNQETTLVLLVFLRFIWGLYFNTWEYPLLERLFW